MKVSRSCISWPREMTDPLVLVVKNIVDLYIDSLFSFLLKADFRRL